MEEKRDTLEYRRALCCWTLISTATPNNAAETNMAMQVWPRMVQLVGQ